MTADEQPIGRADLHIHSVASDGTADIRSILDHVAARGDLDVVAITDHERIDAAVAARAVALDRGLPFEVVVGEEVTTRGGHLLALFIDRPIRPYQSLRASIQAVHDAGAVGRTERGQVDAAAEQCVHERPVTVAVRGMHHESGLLGHHHDVVVLVSDVDRDRLCHRRPRCGHRTVSRVDGDHVAGRQRPAVRACHAVDHNRAGCVQRSHRRSSGSRPSAIIARYATTVTTTPTTMSTLPAGES